MAKKPKKTSVKFLSSKIIQPEKSVVLFKVTIRSSRETTAGEKSFLLLLENKVEQSKARTAWKHKQETHSEINQLTWTTEGEMICNVSEREQQQTDSDLNLSDKLPDKNEEIKQTSELSRHVMWLA